MCGSNSIHTGLQYCAVDSITASFTPCSSSHNRSRINSLVVAPKRRRWPTSGCPASTSSTTAISTFLCTSIPAILYPIVASWCGSGGTRGIRRYAPSRATTAPTRKGGATLIGPKRAFQTKLRNGLNSPRATTAFSVPHPRRLSDFHPLWWAAMPIQHSGIQVVVGIVVSHPCANEKAQRWSTEILWLNALGRLGFEVSQVSE